MIKNTNFIGSSKFREDEIQRKSTKSSAYWEISIIPYNICFGNNTTADQRRQSISTFKRLMILNINHFIWRN